MVLIENIATRGRHSLFLWEFNLEKDAYYFPHFYNARHDRKIKRVRKELGVEGYGIYFMLLEVLRDQSEFKYPLEDIDLLADEFGTSEQKVRTVIANYQLFEVDDDDNFFSSKFIFYLQPYLMNKENKRIAGIRGNLIKYNYITKEQSKGMTNSDILLLHNELDYPSHSDSNAIAIKGNKKKLNKKKLISTKHKYGEYKHVLLTDEEYEKLKDKVDNREEWIKKLDEGIELKGYKYKNHYLAILKWYKSEKEKIEKKYEIVTEFEEVAF